MIQAGVVVKGTLVRILNAAVARQPNLEFIQEVLGLSSDFQEALIRTKDGLIDTVKAEELLPETISN